MHFFISLITGYICERTKFLNYEYSLTGFQLKMIIAWYVAIGAFPWVIYNT